MLGGAEVQAPDPLDDEACLQQLQELIADGMKASDAARDLAQRSGRSKRELYALLHTAENQAD